MKTVRTIIVALIFTPMSIYGQEAGHDRQPSVAGSFYPASPDKLRYELSSFFRTCSAPQKELKTRALLVPHAGYVFSGHTAAAAFATIQEGTDYDNIFVIGTSHRYSFEGAAVFTAGDMVTPLGTVTVNKELGERLIETNRYFFVRDQAHIPEHSLEVVLPFIQYHLGKSARIVPLLLGTKNTHILKSIAEELKPYFTEKNLFIISSDFSHYPSYNDAITADRKISDAIISASPETFLKAIRDVESEGIEGLATAMCGWPGGLILIYLTEDDKNIVYRNVEYRNSGDSPYGSKDEVVGYNAIAAAEKTAGRINPGRQDSFTLSSEEKKILLAIARNAIDARVHGRIIPETDIAKMTPSLCKPLGAFVTITINGNLRGCIGNFTSTEPLYIVVQSMAQESAFDDPRFPDLTEREYPEIEIEISVIGPMKKIDGIDDIIIGKHGIYVRKGMRAGTLLPQVATERGWSVTEFLGYCSRDKAGIGWDGWKDAEVFVYEAYVFSE